MVGQGGASQGRAQLAPGADAELGEDLAQVPLDGPGADEQLGADLGGGELAAGAFGEGSHADLVQGVVRLAQLAAGVAAAVLAAQPLPVQQARLREPLRPGGKLTWPP
jgi:hypothetical protein